jgi:hypothetical protein
VPFVSLVNSFISDSHNDNVYTSTVDVEGLQNARIFAFRCRSDRTHQKVPISFRSGYIRSSYDRQGRYLVVKIRTREMEKLFQNVPPTVMTFFLQSVYHFSISSLKDFDHILLTPNKESSRQQITFSIEENNSYTFL